MESHPLSDAAARAMRQAWFDYLAHAEPHRGDLFRYALRLTQDVFSAEDLVQDTLLRGFGAIGRGDLHGDASRVRDARAYLFRIASNLWVDLVRRRQFAPLEPLPPATLDASGDNPGARAPGDHGPNVDAAVDAQAHTAASAARLFAVASPQERAAIVLKEVFDYTAREIAELLDTTEGAVKAALHRGRQKLVQVPHTARHAVPDEALLARFVAAFEARDARALTACLLDTVSIEVQGVGGGRGHEGLWVESSLRHAVGRVEVRNVAGWPVLLHIHAEHGVEVLDYVTRLEMADGRVARIQDYCYCPDLIAEVAAECGLRAARPGYHQPPDTLARMVASTGLPWRAAR